MQAWPETTNKLHTPIPRIEKPARESAESTRQPYLSSYKYKSKLELSSRFYDLMRAEPQSKVAFAAVLGMKGSGKSVLVDKLLEAYGGSKGAVFSRLGATVGGWMATPPIKGRGVSVYLVDTQGFEDLSSSKQRAVLSFLYLTCSLVILNVKSNEERAQQLFKEAFASIALPPVFDLPELLVVKRDSQADKLSPRVTQVNCAKGFRYEKRMCLESPLSRRDLTSESIQNLDLQGLSQQFSNGVRHMVEQLKVVTPRKLNFTETNCSIATVVHQFLADQLNKSSSAGLELVWARLLQQLYIDAFNYATILYTDRLDKFLRDEKPVEQARLLEQLELAKEQALDSYLSRGFTEESKPIFQKYKHKLSKLIQTKEGQLIKINQSKLSSSKSVEVDRLCKLLRQEKDQGQAFAKFKKLVALNCKYPELLKSTVLPSLERLQQALKNSTTVSAASSKRSSGMAKLSQLTKKKEQLIKKINNIKQPSRDLDKEITQAKTIIQNKQSELKAKKEKEKLQKMEAQLKASQKNEVPELEKQLEKWEKSVKEKKKQLKRVQAEAEKAAGCLN